MTKGWVIWPNSILEEFGDVQTGLGESESKIYIWLRVQIRPWTYWRTGSFNNNTCWMFTRGPRATAQRTGDCLLLAFGFLGTWCLHLGTASTAALGAVATAFGTTAGWRPASWTAKGSPLWTVFNSRWAVESALGCFAFWVWGLWVQVLPVWLGLGGVVSFKVWFALGCFGLGLV